MVYVTSVNKSMLWTQNIPRTFFEVTQQCQMVWIHMYNTYPGLSCLLLPVCEAMWLFSEHQWVSQGIVECSYTALDVLRYGNILVTLIHIQQVFEAFVFCLHTEWPILLFLSLDFGLASLLCHFFFEGLFCIFWVVNLCNVKNVNDCCPICGLWRGNLHYRYLSVCDVLPGNCGDCEETWDVPSSLLVMKWG